ncbi:MAG TPA: class I SAM-dependent methyltransferase [Rhizomicrobium sp.]|jgi:2-polyprenyl-3-methyl-5-hydroxy-6-metoxy-1,4-benzoquinol methylase|nr:class I SAM-dependent methyltransferase [Rhizomicrobium sp.]
MDLVDLSDSQNAQFNWEIHTRRDLRKKLALLASCLGGSDKQLLDLGGGNGTFLDAVLDAYPQAQGTLLDISPSLIAANKPRAHKTIVIGSVAQMEALLPRRDYDVITLNWLLHHLVGPSYASCGDNCVATLKQCKAMLGDGGVIVIAEANYQGAFGGRMPSWLIYTLTSIRTEWIARRLKTFANTAGNGVCFRSAEGWHKIFARAGLKVVHEEAGSRRWRWRWFWPLLGIYRPWHRHFYLQPV